jgi:murein DD-endopeptidase MepM/ murein hydrolase activator NlpD
MVRLHASFGDGDGDENLIRSRLRLRLRLRLRKTFYVAISIGAFAPAPLQAQSAQVSWTPERPVHGTLFRLRVTGLPQDLASIRGTVAGEPLHFGTARNDTIEALAAVPLDHGPVLEVPLALARSGGAVDTVRASVPVTQGTYRLERLTVAPRFGAPPDSATAARIAREQQRALAVARAAHETPRLWRDVVLPRASRITSGFGSGREFNGQVQSRHTGTDFAGAVGSPVRAAARGVVALIDTFHLAGRVIYIDHGAGLVSGYFHLSRQLVATGDTVAAGQTIGHVGATGRVTGPHLHWVVRYGGITVDPMTLVELAKHFNGSDTERERETETETDGNNTFVPSPSPSPSP